MKVRQLLCIHLLMFVSLVSCPVKVPVKFQELSIVQSCIVPPLTALVISGYTVIHNVLSWFEIQFSFAE